MTAASPRQASYEALLALPDNIVGEIVEGEVVVSPRPGPRHAIAATSLGATLLPPLQFGDGGPGGWWIIAEPELHLGTDVVVPDLAGWRRARLTDPPSEPFFTVSPDWVCEILSPSTARLDRTKKLPIYARAGVSHLWLVDPVAQLVETYALELGHWVLLAAHGGGGTIRAAPFEAVTVDLARLWGGHSQA